MRKTGRYYFHVQACVLFFVDVDLDPQVFFEAVFKMIVYLSSL